MGGGRWNKSLRDRKAERMLEGQGKEVQGRAGPWQKGKRSNHNSLFEKKNNKTQFLYVNKNKN